MQRDTLTQSQLDVLHRDNGQSKNPREERKHSGLHWLLQYESRVIRPEESVDGAGPVVIGDVR